MTSNKPPDLYFRRFGYCARQIARPVNPNLGMVVVIPCFNEPDLLGSLEALWSCQLPTCAVETIVVINSAAGCAPEIRARNEATLELAWKWAQSHWDPKLTFHVLSFLDLPSKQAGVGLARKIGMDEAAARLMESAAGGSGVITCFDADCVCDANYLTGLEEHFAREQTTPGCSIYFEHPLEGLLSPLVYEAVAAYELHLRFYVQALRFAGFPYAYHTVGSAMAVRACVYMNQGGMNRRQAGEDFYFLNKIIPLGGFTELNTTRVLPSPRPSDRVPFGTGRAVRASLAGDPMSTYPLEAFLELKVLFEGLDNLYQQATWAGTEFEAFLSPALRSFLAEESFEAALAEVRANTASFVSFRKRFFGWFNAFRVMKCVHHARDAFYGERPVIQESRALLTELSRNCPTVGGTSPRPILGCFRELQREPWQPPTSSV